MTADANAYPVIHNAAEKRFEIALPDGQLALVEYMRFTHAIAYTHTEVPPAYEGQGLANRLAEAALHYAQAENLKVNPLCPFIKLYVSKHPEYHAITIGFDG